MTRLKICFIAGRNLGDAVILSRYIKKLSSYRALDILVWSTIVNAKIFESIPNVSVYKSYFPIANKSFFYTPHKIFNFIFNVFNLRKEKIDISMDITGDFREIFLSNLIGSAQHYAPKWPDGHPFKNIIRLSNLFTCHYINIPPKLINIYKAVDFMFSNLFKQLGITTDDEHPIATRIPKHIIGAPIKIAIHPFASQKCKIWNSTHWNELVRILLSNNYLIYVVCSPNELHFAKNIFKSFSKEVNFISEQLNFLSFKLSSFNLLIGLDSFAIHFADSIGIKTITIVGSNPPELWCPPLGVSITTPNTICAFKPCFNNPKCISKNFEFNCINKIKPYDVYALTQKVLYDA